MAEIGDQVTTSPLCSTHCFTTRIRAWTRFGHFVTMRLPFYNLISTNLADPAYSSFRPQSAATTIKHSTRRTTFFYHLLFSACPVSSSQTQVYTLPDSLVARRSNSLMTFYASINSTKPPS